MRTFGFCTNLSEYLFHAINNIILTGIVVVVAVDVIVGAVVVAAVVER